MEQDWNLQEIIEYYKTQGAAKEQPVLIELLREVQEQCGGIISLAALSEIAAGLDMKASFLSALIKRYPSIRTEEAPHLLEVCGGERCQRNACGELHRFIGEKYKVKNGDVSSLGGFTYKITGCMKNCTKGPSLKWDGKLYSNADKELIQSLIEGMQKRGSRMP